VRVQQQQQRGEDEAAAGPDQGPEGADRDAQRDEGEEDGCGQRVPALASDIGKLF
jgi:hypothetical protein